MPPPEDDPEFEQLFDPNPPYLPTEGEADIPDPDPEPAEVEEVS